LEIEEDPTVPDRMSTEYSEVRSSTQEIFDESLAFSFQKVVEQSVMEIFNGNGMTGFQESLRDGMNSIACTLQKRVVEGVDKTGCG